MKEINFKGRIIFSIFLLVLLNSCNRTETLENTSDIKVQIDRFEEDLFSIDLYNLADSISFLKQKYPEFLPLFTYKVINIGGPDDPGFSNKLLAFVSDFTNYRVSKRVKEVFPDLYPYEKELSVAFGRYQEAFPGESIPELISCITGFNQSIITSDNLLAISLDKYLGFNDEFYTLLYPPVPDYMRRVMRPERITSDALLAWVITSFNYNDEKNNLLSGMIYNGRAIYCVKQLMPQLQDTLLWGYTGKQLKFCKDNERRMWEYLVENKKLFETDQFMLNQFINDAPFTKDFSRNSPGRAVVWLGYQIVSSYVKHENSSMEDLMMEDDYQKILNLSKYNP